MCNILDAVDSQNQGLLDEPGNSVTSRLLLKAKLTVKVSFSYHPAESTFQNGSGYLSIRPPVNILFYLYYWAAHFEAPQNNIDMVLHNRLGHDF